MKEARRLFLQSPLWPFESSPVVFQHSHLNIVEMETSPNHELWLKEAQMRMEKWEEGEESYNENGKGKTFNPWSTIHVDRNGVIIAAIFAYRVMVCALYIVILRSLLMENPGQGPQVPEERRKYNEFG